MLGRPGCIGPAPDKIYIIFPQHLSSVRHKKNFRSWGLGSRLSVGSRLSDWKSGPNVLLKLDFWLFVTSHHSSLCRDIRSSPEWTDPARDEHHQNHLCGSNVKEKNYEGTKKQKLEITPKLHMSEAGLAKVHFITWALIWLIFSHKYFSPPRVPWTQGCQPSSISLCPFHPIPERVQNQSAFVKR